MDDLSARLVWLTYSSLLFYFGPGILAGAFWVLRSWLVIIKANRDLHNKLGSYPRHISKEQMAQHMH
jgi:hypothetical protein